MRSSRSGSPGAFSAILPNMQLSSTLFERSKQRQDGAPAGESGISNLPGVTKFPAVVGSPVHSTSPLLDERLRTFSSSIIDTSIHASGHPHSIWRSWTISLAFQPVILRIRSKPWKISCCCDSCVIRRAAVKNDARRHGSQHSRCSLFRAMLQIR